MPVVGFSANKLTDVEKHMKHLTTNIHTQLCARVKMWPLLSAALEGFGGDFAWVDDDEAFNESSHQKLAAILDNLKGPLKENCDMESCLIKVYVHYENKYVNPSFLFGYLILDRTRLIRFVFFFIEW